MSEFDGADYIVGPRNAEDLAHLPGTHWLVATGMTDVSGRPGSLYAFHTQNMTWKEIYRGCNERDPLGERGEPTLRGFAPHGLALQSSKDRLHKLYVVNHGDGETIEIFEIDAGAIEPTARWLNRVIMPAGTCGNDVVALGTGGFAVTNMFNPDDERALDKMEAGDVTGNVLEWNPERGWDVVPGSETSGPNGIEVSADGKWLFIGSWGATRAVARLSRDLSSREKSVLYTGLLNDNLTWSAAGTLLLAAHDSSPRAFNAEYSTRTTLSFPFEVLEINPSDLTIIRRWRHDGEINFGAGTVALEVDDDVWVGTSRGDRVARLPRRMKGIRTL
jgi:hypothetical protein